MINKDTPTKELLMLIKAQRDGADEACKILYARFMPTLCTDGESHGLSFTDAEDVAQDTLIQVIRRIETFKEQCGDGNSWIYSIHRNKMTDRWRRKVVLQFEPLLETHPCLEQDSPEQWIERDHLRQAIVRAWARLPEWAQRKLQPGYGPGRRSNEWFQARDLFRALLDEERKND